VIVNVKVVVTAGPGLTVGVNEVVAPGIVTVGEADHWNPFTYGIAALDVEGTVKIDADPALQLLSVIIELYPGGVE
jgi:hypothetical protein